MTPTNRVHYFHADASAAGGYFQLPIERNLPPQAPMSLSPSGGYGFARSENFRLDGVLSYKSAYTQAAGHLSNKPGHGWVTLVTSVIEGLNVLDVITADRLAAQISTEHPLEGNNPKVNFLGTSFENLKIAGYPIHITLDLDICDQGNGNGYPKQSCVSDEQFRRRVAGQYQDMIDADARPDWVSDRAIPDWIKERYKWDAAKATSNGSILCSIVKEANGQFPGRPFGNVFEVPGFGRVFLGELLVDCKSYQLTMVRLEMGCAGEGSGGFGTAKANGGTIPPGG
ncbi:MAG: hypothetical protein WAL52_02710 [Candidatus Sulfotelmatobacter sp.]